MKNALKWIDKITEGHPVKILFLINIFITISNNDGNAIHILRLLNRDKVLPRNSLIGMWMYARSATVADKKVILLTVP